MRLVGTSIEGQSWVAVEIDSGIAAVASVDDFYRNVKAGLAIARAITQAETSVRPTAVPIPGSAKILCAGLNYVNHAAEAKHDLPPHPDVFARWASTLVWSGDEVPLPSKEPGLDWEGELAAVIGVELKDASPEEVEAGILGYTCLNDLSARIHQRATGQWTIGKNADRSAPIGPAIVTRDEIGNPYSLRLQTRVNGQTMQNVVLSEMIFSIGRIGSYASETMTLCPGDVISTGTPQGIGSVRKPPIFLTGGDLVEVEIDSIGILSTRIQSGASHDQQSIGSMAHG